MVARRSFSAPFVAVELARRSVIFPEELIARVPALQLPRRRRPRADRSFCCATLRHVDPLRSDSARSRDVAARPQRHRACSPMTRVAAGLLRARLAHGLPGQRRRAAAARDSGTRPRARRRRRHRLRRAWRGRGIGRVALMAAATAAAGVGVAMGTLADARRWAPPGVDVVAMEQATARGEVLQVDGVLRHDAWMSPGGGVALDLEVTSVSVGRRVDPRVPRRPRDGRSAIRHCSAPRLDSRPRRPRHVRLRCVVRCRTATSASRMPSVRWHAAGCACLPPSRAASMVEATPGPWWEEAAARVRAGIRRVDRDAHVRDPAAAATVAAILIGDRSGLDHDDRSRPAARGRVSRGRDLGRQRRHLAGGAAVPAACRRRRRADVGLWWLAAGLIAFAAVVDGGASVARAVTVAAVVLAARWWDVRTPAMQALVVAAGLQWLLRSARVARRGLCAVVRRRRHAA